jgi:DNA invertase Pin-like site-specific DNA recombinase
MTTAYIAYLRVSTSKQAASHLGLDSQQRIVRDFVEKSDGALLHEIIEVESGGKDNRPELKRALDLCKKHSAVLLLPKLDRLSRSVSFISRLMDSGIRFVVCDLPGATDFTLHLYAALGQEERRLISERTRNALAAARARGTELGRNGKALAAQNKDAAIRFIREIRPQINAIQAEGHLTSQGIANELNKRQIPTFRGGSTKWHQPQVHRLLKRMGALPSSGSVENR